MSAGHSLRPLTAPSHEWASIRLPRVRDLDRVAHSRCFIIGNAKQRQGHWLSGIVQPLHRRELGWLVFERIEPMQIAEENLQRDQNDQKIKCHSDHHARIVDRTIAPQQPRSDTHHHERRRDVEGSYVMQQTIGKRRIEDDCEPVYGLEAPID